MVQHRFQVQVRVGTVSDGTCLVRDNDDAREVTQTVPATPDLSLKLEVLDSIYGNILIKESDTQDMSEVQINIKMRATSAQLLEQLEQSLSRLDAPFNGYRSTIHIHDRNDKEKKKRLLRRNCARADVEIMYPRPSPGTGRLEVSVANGELALKMSPPRKTGHAWDMLTSFEEVRLKLLNGGINFENLVVSRALHVEVANGHIRGNVHSAGTIAAQTMNGQIQLGIDTNPLRADWSPSNLMVNAETLNGEIELNMIQRFIGHFRLSTTMGSTSIHQISQNKDVLKYSRQSSKARAGWISADGSEPQNVTPRIELETINGAITLNV
ncbi:MAG: hypothetical protein J3Q66DRAFT_370352 [Benniella sp.]|nr:MAG: hypothetical protein J3Q66DRAFT_370352 [Benniella sp.]